MFFYVTIYGSVKLVLDSLIVSFTGYGNQRSMTISVNDTGLVEELFFHNGTKFVSKPLPVLQWFVDYKLSIVTNGLADIDQWIPFRDRLINGEQICVTVEVLGEIGDQSLPYYKVLGIEEDINKCSL